jgi:ubiquinone/menaquinone biosynthesis C-methylase UbiE
MNEPVYRKEAFVMTEPLRNVPSSRSLQIAAWIAAIIFVLGFFVPMVGACTGTILGAWFVRTQKALRGFLWMMAFSLFFGLLWHWRLNPLADSIQAGKFLAWTVLVAVSTVLPFTLYRLVSPRLPGLISTLPLPLAGAAILAFTEGLHLDGKTPASGAQLLLYWLAVVVVWMWREEFRPLYTGTDFFLAVGLGLLIHFSSALQAIPIGHAAGWGCCAGFLSLGVWALAATPRPQPWAQRPEAVARLQSPYSGNSLKVVSERGHEELVSSSGERFAIRKGVPVFLQPEDLAGDNGKYHHLYETIGGFYDDAQRVFCALKGFDRDAYFLSYMRLVDVNPGDAVLETSVGTGLNFQYLPREAKLTGLDLSPEMLANCAENLRRWKLEADLILGNAERLPFADASFDVVFHVGGINFFNDRARAIQEMIRVCKPGGHLLIADETEKHVKEVYEKMPGGLFKNRKQPVSAPIDLVPPEMEGTQLTLLKDGMFYAITFRKPAQGATGSLKESEKIATV